MLRPRCARLRARCARRARAASARPERSSRDRPRYTSRTRGSPCTWSTLPSLRILPSCSTVTERAKRRRNAMSCSITTTVWSPASSSSSSPVAWRSEPLMPATGSSSSTSFGSLHEQHADLQPLLLAVAEHAGRAVAWRLQADPLERGGDPVADAPAPAQQPAAAGSRYVSARSRFSTTVSDSNTVGVWKLRPMPRRTRLAADTPASGWPSNVIVALRRLGEPGDDVDQRRLAGAVGADEEAQLALLDRQVDAVDGLEAVEVDDDAAQRRAARSLTSPSAPSGDRRRARRGSRRPPASAPRRRRTSRPPTSADEADDAAGDEGHHDDEQQALHVLPRVGPLLADRVAPQLTRMAPMTAP